MAEEILDQKSESGQQPEKRQEEKSHAVSTEGTANSRKNEKSRRPAMSLQMKLVLTFFLTSAIIMFVNLFLFVNINSAIDRIDRVYMTNAQISDLSDALSNVQAELTAYLNTKSTESLSSFYEAETDYQDLLNNMNFDGQSEEAVAMLDDIGGLSRSYLMTAENALSAKRGRNIQRYRQYYDDAEELNNYLNTYIYSLNSLQFRSNSVNYTTLRQTFAQLEFTSIMVLIAVMMADLLITLGFTRALTRPMTQLAHQANEISEGNFDVPALEVKSNDEIGVVTSAFNEMTRSIRENIAKLRESMKKENEMKEKELLMDSHLKEAELKYLQAQINPHFLFNTLNAGAQLAMMENADTTYRYLQNVASFFRSKTNREKQVTTLADEISLADNYIYIINVRFSGSINYEKRVDEDLVNVSVPSMILQPIIENAVNHGVRDIDWPAKIILSVYMTGNMITISVKDNGRGMSSEQIEDILAGKTTPRKRGDETNGVGLSNVVSRLRLFYDREDVFDITSGGENKGTEVLLYIPAP